MSRLIWSSLGGAICLLALFSGAYSQLYFSQKELEPVKAVQLWYNGYWKHPGWINGTLVSQSFENKRGCIVVVKDVAAPYDKYIREQISNGAAAILFLRARTGVPGQTMYLVTGRSQADLNIPVVEIFQEDEHNSDSIASLVNSERTLQVSIWPQENKWKSANDKTAFQVVFNVIHSFMSLGVIMIGCWRLYEWWKPEEAVWISIGPVCLILEIIGGAIRFAYCIVDPIWTFRVLPDSASFLLTFNLPFSFSSGILLTFFWAETLQANKVRASPFISDYKIISIGICILLFVAEIVCDIVRILVPVTGWFNPSYIAQALYVITAIVLTICYIICAYKIQKKIGNLTGKKRKLRNMTLRFAGSTAGYISFAILTILLIPFIGAPWGFKVILNLTIFVSNSWSLLQVYSFTAPQKRLRASSADVGTPRSVGPNAANSYRTDFSRGLSSLKAASVPQHDDFDTTEDSSESDRESSDASSVALSQHDSDDDSSPEDALEAKNEQDQTTTELLGSEVDHTNTRTTTSSSTGTGPITPIPQFIPNQINLSTS